MQANQEDPLQGTINAFLRVPRALTADRTQYYSKRSRLIVLEGPRGMLLAHYHSPVAPDPRQHRFHCTYPRNYSVFRGVRVPDITHADVQAVAFPIDNIVDDRSPVVAGTQASMDSDLAPASDEVHIIPPTVGKFRGMRQPGMRVSPRGIVGSFEGGGFVVDKNGMKIEGQVQTREVSTRGVTTESPLWGILPKTAVTFYASDVLPDVAKMNRYINIVTLLYAAYRAITSFAAILNTALADDETTPGAT